MGQCASSPGSRRAESPGHDPPLLERLEPQRPMPVWPPGGPAILARVVADGLLGRLTTQALQSLLGSMIFIDSGGESIPTEVDEMGKLIAEVIKKTAASSAGDEDADDIQVFRPGAPLSKAAGDHLLLEVVRVSSEWAEWMKGTSTSAALKPAALSIQADDHRILKAHAAAWLRAFFSGACGAGRETLTRLASMGHWGIESDAWEVALADGQGEDEPRAFQTPVC